MCTPSQYISSSEEILPRLTRRTLAQQLNHPSSNHTYTQSMLNHIHHHYAPFVTRTHTAHIICCCCLPTHMTFASGGSPMFPLVVHQPASPFIWPAVQLLRRGLSTNPGVTMWCVCGCN